jgi:hypothetical protein
MARFVIANCDLRSSPILIGGMNSMNKCRRLALCIAAGVL